MKLAIITAKEKSGSIHIRDLSKAFTSSAGRGHLNEMVLVLSLAEEASNSINNKALTKAFINSAKLKCSDTLKFLILYTFDKMNASPFIESVQNSCLTRHEHTHLVDKQNLLIQEFKEFSKGKKDENRLNQILDFLNLAHSEVKQSE